jgi:hypothetical protein
VRTTIVDKDAIDVANDSAGLWSLSRWWRYRNTIQNAKDRQETKPAWVVVLFHSDCPSTTIVPAKNPVALTWLMIRLISFGRLPNAGLPRSAHLDPDFPAVPGATQTDRRRCPWVNHIAELWTRLGFERSISKGTRIASNNDQL